MHSTASFFNEAVISEYLHGDKLSMRKWIIIVVTAPLASSGGIGGGSDAPVFVSPPAHQVQV